MNRLSILVIQNLSKHLDFKLKGRIKNNIFNDNKYGMESSFICKTYFSIAVERVTKHCLTDVLCLYCD